MKWGFLRARAGEPSTWAGLATLLIGGGLTAPEMGVNELASQIALVVGALSGVTSVFFREKGPRAE